MIRPLSPTSPLLTELTQASAAEAREQRAARMPHELGAWATPPAEALPSAPPLSDRAGRVGEALERQVRRGREAGDGHPPEEAGARGAVDEARSDGVRGADGDSAEGAGRSAGAGEGSGFEALLRRGSRAAGDGAAEAAAMQSAGEGEQASGTRDALAGLGLTRRLAGAPSEGAATRAEGAATGAEGAGEDPAVGSGEAPALAPRRAAEAAEAPATARSAEVAEASAEAGEGSNAKAPAAASAREGAAEAAEVARAVRNSAPQAAQGSAVNSLTPGAGALNAELARLLGLTRPSAAVGEGEAAGLDEGGVGAALEAGGPALELAPVRVPGANPARVDPAQAARDIGAQITDAVRGLVADADGERALRFHSPELGSFTALVKSDGRDLVVHLLADDSAARAALAARAPEVRDALVRAQVTPGEVDVRADGGGGRERDGSPADPDAQAAEAASPPARPRPRRVGPNVASAPDAVRGRTVDLIA